MKSELIRLSAAVAVAMLAGTAIADHNSKWGEGWAKMPNDIHNMRVETRGDNEAFREFVKKGAGAASENRFEADDEGRLAPSKRGDAAHTAGDRRPESAKNATATDNAAAEPKASSRERSRARAELRQNERSAVGTRGHARSTRGSGGRGRR